MCHHCLCTSGRLRYIGAVLCALMTLLPLTGCKWQEITPEAKQTAETAEPKTTQPATSSGLLAVKAAVAPTVDGQDADPAWDKAPAYTIPLQGYSGKQLTMQAVYTDAEIYFLLSWSDYSHSVRQARSWGRVHVGAQFGKLPTEAVDKWERFGEEDSLSLIWNIDAADFGQAEVPTKMHLAGAKLSAGHADRWYWAAGSTNPVRKLLDQYLDANGLHDDSGSSFLIPNVASKDDPATSFNDQAYPGYMPRADLTHRKIPKLFVVQGEKPVLLYYRSEVERFNLGTVDREATLPSFIFADSASGSVADVTATALHSADKETWTLEIRRQRVTATPGEDVQFDNLAKTYPFVVGVFDNTEVDGSFSQVHQLTFGK